jgi:cell division protein FtsQ
MRSSSWATSRCHSSRRSITVRTPPRRVGGNAAAANSPIVAEGSGSRSRPRPRARAASAVVPFGRPASPGGRALPDDLGSEERPSSRLELLRFAPSGRSLALGLLLLAAAAGAYALARGTSAFAVREIAVEGAPAHVATQVRTALASARGESLLQLDVAGLGIALAGVPTVAAADLDRSFPHTLRVTIVPERPVAVLRRGSESWLAAASGRVIASLDRGARPLLPRVWLGRAAEVRIGDTVTGDVRRAVRAVAPLARHRLPARVASVRSTPQELTLVLRSGVEVRLGDASDRALKLELARRILPSLGETDGYLDVSVPARPVAGPTLQSQVEVETQTSTEP